MPLQNRTEDAVAEEAGAEVSHSLQDAAGPAVQPDQHGRAGGLQRVYLDRRCDSGVQLQGI